MKIFIESSGLFLGKCGIKRYAEEVIYGLQQKIPQDKLISSRIAEILKPSTQVVSKKDCQEIIQTHFNNYELFVAKNHYELIKKIADINRAIKSNTEQSQIYLLQKTKRELLRILKNTLNALFNESMFMKHRLKDIRIYHQLFDFIPNEIQEINSIKKCLTVHDIIQAIRPDLMVGRHNARKVASKIKRISNKETIFTVSQFTKDDLCNFNSKINPENVHVTHNGVANHFTPISDQKLIQQVKSKYKIPQQTRFVLGSFTSDPKKNTPFIIKNFLDLIKSERIKDLHLVLTGGNKIFDNALLEKEINLIKKNKKHITLTGFVDDDEMAVLHSSSMCFCFPSLYEGFGLPVLEAMQCGAPVITSNVTSLPEIAGDAALLVDPQDNEAFQNAMLSLYKNSGLRKNLSEKGKQRAALFSWDNCVDKTLAVYNQLNQ